MGGIESSPFLSIERQLRVYDPDVTGNRRKCGAQ